MNTCTETNRKGTLTEHAPGDERELILAVLDDGISHAAELERFTLTTAGLFRAGRERAALDHYIDLLGSLDMLVRALAETGRGLEVDFSNTSIGGVTLERFVDQLNGLLRETMAAQQRRDWVLIADLLEYELKPHLDQWKGVFAILREKILTA